MQYSILGKSDLKISKIGFGCMSLKEDEVENKRIVSKAVEHGVNYFDTADLYEKGENEVKIGKLLKSYRNQLVIATKVGNQWRPDGTGWDWNPRKNHIVSAIEESLKRLQTDYIDLYQLHGGTIEDPFEEIVETFELLKAQGKIRHYGISSIRPNVIRKYVEQAGISSVMMQYSLLDRRPEEQCLELLRNNNIGVVSRGGLAQGLLVDKAAKPYLNWSEEEVNRVAGRVQEITPANGTSAQTSIRYVLQNPAINSAVIGIRTIDQLRDVITAADLSPLSADEMEQISNALPVSEYKEHR